MGSPRSRGLSRNDLASRNNDNASYFGDKSKKSYVTKENAAEAEDVLDEKKMTMLLITEDNCGDLIPVRVGSLLSNGGGALHPRMIPPASPTNNNNGSRKKRRQMDAIFGGHAHAGLESRRSFDIKKGDNNEQEEEEQDLEDI